MIKKNKLACCVALALGAASSGAAFAQAPVSNLVVDPYGQINHGLMVTDSAAGTKTYTADNDNSASRAGVKISGDVVDTGLTVGAHVELEYQVNP
ncbi:MAG: porin, partial [Pseudomonadota bacterium]|nr:porin [Pseudomonadota bacterium]